MNQIWTHADLIDLEYCLNRDRQAVPADLHRRDRQIYLESTSQKAARSRETLIYQWLGARKQQLFGNGVSPGRTVSQGFRQLSYLVVLTASILGLISGLGFLPTQGPPRSMSSTFSLFSFSASC